MKHAGKTRNMPKKQETRRKNMKHAEKSRNMPEKHGTCRKNTKHVGKRNAEKMDVEILARAFIASIQHDQQLPNGKMTNKTINK